MALSLKKHDTPDVYPVSEWSSSKHPTFNETCLVDQLGEGDVQALPSFNMISAGVFDDSKYPSGTISLVTPPPAANLECSLDASKNQLPHNGLGQQRHTDSRCVYQYDIPVIRNCSPLANYAHDQVMSCKRLLKKSHRLDVSFLKKCSTLPPDCKVVVDNPCSGCRPATSPDYSGFSKELAPTKHFGRACGNCSVLETRQWVRGNGRAWLCHSCGQFWRKNGYPRPRSLWNRPTFKRSSRKQKLLNANGESSRRSECFKGRPQSLSTSFLKGKRMVECSQLLLDPRGLSRSRKTPHSESTAFTSVPSSEKCTLQNCTEPKENSCNRVGELRANLPQLPPLSHLLKDLPMNDHH